VESQSIYYIVIAIRNEQLIRQNCPVATFGPHASVNANSDPTPNITGVSPSSWNAGATTPVRITGSGFGTNPSVNITDPSSSVTTSSVTPVSDQEVDVNVTVAGNAPAENATITVTSSGYNGFGFVTTQGNSPASPSISVTVVPIQVTQSPSTIFVSTGDTTDVVTVSISPGGTYSVSFLSSLQSNPNSNATAQLTGHGSSNGGGTQNYAVTASGAGSSPSGIFSLLACASGKCASQGSTVVVPPQVLIQDLYGEAHGQAAAGDGISEPAIGSAIRNRFGKSEFPGGSDATYQGVLVSSQFPGIDTSILNGPQPELNVAGTLFNGTQGDLVAGSPCFFSPKSSDWAAVQAALSSGTTDVPSLSSVDPKCYSQADPGTQIVYYSAVGSNANGNGAPAFLFERQKSNDSDPAVVQIN